MDHDQSDVTDAQSAIQLGIVPVSPAAARIAALEAEVARLMALTAAKPLAIAEPSEPAARPAFPIRALGRQHQRIGLISELR
jgi:uncharacterized small protein (DUF1192 family)